MLVFAHRLDRRIKKLKNKRYEAVVCGAGIAGVSSAYYLMQAGLKRILLIDQGAPLSLTSDKSTECFRN